MKTYDWKTDAASGETEAASAQEALDKIVGEENITSATLADGGWAWVEAQDGSEERLSIEGNCDSPAHGRICEECGRPGVIGYSVAPELQLHADAGGSLACVDCWERWKSRM